MRASLLFVGWAVICGAPSSSFGEMPVGPEAARTIAAFPTEKVLEQWRFLEDSLLRTSQVRATLVKWDFNEREGDGKPLTPPIKQRWTVDQNGDDFLVQMEGKSNRQTLGRNRDYAFQLGKREEAKSWSLSEFENSAHVGTVTPFARDWVLNFLRAPYVVWCYPVRVLFQSHGMRNVIATSVGSGQTEVVTVKFEREGDLSSGKNIDYIASGVIRFEPARHWAIRDYEIVARAVPATSRRAPTTRVMEKCTYRSPGSSELASVQFDSEMLVRGEAQIDRTAVTIEEIKPSTLTANGYTLPAFGVSVPPLPGSKSPLTSRWFWVLQAGIVALLLGLLIRRRGKQ
jgi:hypothetical protein